MACPSFRVFLLVLVMIPRAAFGSQLLLGDQPTTDAGTSFTFPLLSRAVFDLTNQYFYVAAGVTPPAGSEAYALAGTTLGAPASQPNGFVPFAPETVTLNGAAKSTNPLYGTQIAQLGINNTYPIVVPNNQQTSIYMITSRLSSSNQIIISASNIQDANAQNSAGVVLTDANGLYRTTLTGTGSIVFAAVKPNGGQFGAPHGGIALFTASGGTLVQQQADPNDAGVVKAVEVSTNTTQLQLGANAITSIVANAVDICWDDLLQRLFITVRISNGGATGAQGVLVGYIKQSVVNKQVNQQLFLYPLASASAFTANTDTEIVGSTNANAVIDLYRTRIMHTSTGLSYAIVQGNSSAAHSSLSVYALPLVDQSVNPANNSTWRTSTGHGVLAKNGTTPTQYFKAFGKSPLLYASGRGFQTPATNPGDLLMQTNPAAMVGGGVFNAGAAGETISDMQIFNDTVFISVASATTGDMAGIFYSQAIFDENGVVVLWTPWQTLSYNTVANTTTPASFAFSATYGQMFTLQGPIGTPQTVTRSAWGTAANDGILGGTTENAGVGFMSSVSAQFPFDQSGVMGLFDFNPLTPAFAAGPNTGLSLMVATGYQTVMIIKTGAVNDNDLLVPTVGDFTPDQRTFTAGAINANSEQGGAVAADTALITVTGGVLDQLGAIVSAAIVIDTVDNNGGYLVVGGVGGVAVLCNNNRLGWSHTGLTQNLATSLGTTLSFQMIGNYPNVQKLWAATDSNGDQLLYVLTQTGLYRISATALNSANPTATTLATVEGLGLQANASFADFVACRRLGLLATSAGLYQTGIGVDCSMATNETAAGWTQVVLDQSFASINQLLPLSGTAYPYEFADGAPGQVYYVASSVGYNNAAVGRLAIEDQTGGVTDTTVTEVTYAITQATDGTITQSPFSFLGEYRSFFATNGATLLVGSPQRASTSPALVRLPSITGNSVLTLNYKLENTIKAALPANASTIRGVVRNSATGSWLMYGDFGLRVLE